MTREDHPSGTDRLAEIAETLDAEIVVNIQGDQPFFDANMIDEVVAPLLADPSLEVATLRYPITRQEDLQEPAVVKVVANHDGDALFRGRSSPRARTWTTRVRARGAVCLPARDPAAAGEVAGPCWSRSNR